MSAAEPQPADFPLLSETKVGRPGRCPFCGELSVKRRRDQKYCSRKCQKTANNKKQNAKPSTLLAIKMWKSRKRLGSIPLSRKELVMILRRDPGHSTERLLT